MGLAPRSVLHAVHLDFTAPRLRSARLESGDHALVFEPRPHPVGIPAEVGADAAAPFRPAFAPGGGDGADQPPVPATAPDFSSPSQGLGGPIGGDGGPRLIDDPQTVGFRQGLLSSARGDYDWFVGSHEHQDLLSQLGPVEHVQVPGAPEPLPGIRITPDVQQRLNGGDLPLAPAPQPAAANFGAGRELDPNGFFSASLEAAKALPDRAMTPEEAINRIAKARGVEGFTGRIQDEMDFLGLREHFADQPRVTKGELIDYIQAHRLVLQNSFARFDPAARLNRTRWRLQVTEDPNPPDGAHNMTGHRFYADNEHARDREIAQMEKWGVKYKVRKVRGPDNIPSWSGVRRGPGDIALPGAPVFESTLQLPEGQPGHMHDGHWNRYPNARRGVVVSVRGSEHVDDHGGRTMFGGEVQSDLGQEARATKEQIATRAVNLAEAQKTLDGMGGPVDPQNEVFADYIRGVVGMDAVDKEIVRLDLNVSEATDLRQRLQTQQRIEYLSEPFHAGDLKALQGRLAELQQRLKDRPDEGPGWLTDSIAGLEKQIADLPRQHEAPLAGLTSQWTGAGVRAMVMRAARDGFDSVSFPTAKTSEAIQGNADVAAHYETNVKAALEKVARAVGGEVRRGWIKTQLPMSDADRERFNMGDAIRPRFTRRSAYVMDISPSMRARLVDEGLPLFARGQSIESVPAGDLDARQRVVESHVRAAWGGAARPLMDAGKLHVIASADDLPDPTGIEPWVGAVHYPHSGEVYILADRVSTAQTQSLILHEVGVHYGLEQMIGKQRYRTLLKSIQKRVIRAMDERANGIDPKDADPWLRAWDTVEHRYGGKDGPQAADARQLEETLAHVVEFTDEKFSQLPEEADRAWLAKAMDAVRRWFSSTFGVGDLSPADLHALAVGALRKAGREVMKGAANEPMVAIPAAQVLHFAQARGFTGDDPTAAAQWLDQNGYFSPALEAARRFPAEKGTREQMVNWLSGQPGVKQDELRTLDFDAFKATAKMATRQELVDHIQHNRFTTRIDMKGSLSAGAADSRWGRYTYLQIPESDGEYGWTRVAPDVPAGYFEGLVRPGSQHMPGASWGGGHWREPGVLAHFRGVVDTPVAGKPSTLILEVQSDFHDAKPEDYGNLGPYERQRATDLQSLRRHFGQQAVNLFDRVLHEDNSAELLSATRDGPQDVLVISTAVNRIDARSPAYVQMAREVEAHNREAEALSKKLRDQMTPEQLQANHESAVDTSILRTLSARSHRVRAENAPFRSSWPDIAMREAIRAAVKGGAERVAWSSDAAVRAIPGMETYGGSLYDQRLPRFVKKWLGVDLQSGPIENARTKIDAHSEAWDNAVDSAAHLALTESLAANRGIEQDPELKPHEAKIWDAMRDMMDRIDWTQDASAIEADVSARTVRWVKANGLQKHERPLAVLFMDWATLAHAKIQAFRIRQEGASTQLDAHYFDVTPEIRDKILGPQSQFFGAGRRVQPVDAFPDFGERPADKLARAGADQLSADRAVPTDKAKPPLQDYRYKPLPLRDANTAVGASVAGAAALPLVGMAAAVSVNDMHRRERQAEYDRLRALAQKSLRLAAHQAAEAADAKRLADAVAARDLNALPDMNPLVLKTRSAWLDRAVGWAHQWTGVNPDLVRRLVAWETAFSLDPHAQPPTPLDDAGLPRPNVDQYGVKNGAVGLGQFIPSTFAQAVHDYGARYGVDVGSRSVEDLAHDPQIQALREDPRFAVAMLSETTMADAHELEQRLGRPATSAEIYASHFFGIERATKFFHGVEANLSPDQVKTQFARELPQNGSIFRDERGRVMGARDIMRRLDTNFPGMPYEERPADWSAPARSAREVPAGLLSPGNINLNDRPIVPHDGDVSTVRSITIGPEDDGRFVLIPTVSDDGKVLADRAAISLYRRTGRHLGVFDSEAHADAYAQQLHEDQAAQVARASN